MQMTQAAIDMAVIATLAFLCGGIVVGALAIHARDKGIALGMQLGRAERVLQQQQRDR